MDLFVNSIFSVRHMSNIYGAKPIEKENEMVKQTDNKANQEANKQSMIQKKQTIYIKQLMTKSYR